ncbi:MAG: TlpA disulfide reductase family protein [Sneathiella sp.]
MKTRKLALASLLIALTFTGLGAGTSTAFSQNAESLLKGEMQNFVISSEREALADFSFLGGDGKSRKLSDFRGKVLLVNFWATWCAPCRKEMPGIDRLQAEMKSDKFEVLAIGQDLKGIEKVKKFLKTLKIEHLDAFNDKTVKSGRSAGVFGLPATLLIDAKGQEIGRLVGPAEWDSVEAKELIRFYISTPAT